MGYSHSKVETANQCLYKYKLRYVDKLEPLPDLRPENPLYIGTAVHEGIEHRSLDKAIESYKSHFPELTPAHELEMHKIKCMLEKAITQIPEGEYEYRLSYKDGFIGFIDMLVKVDEGLYDLYDFKVSNDAGRYSESGQVHEYKYFYEKITGNKIRDMYYAMVPKTTTMLTESLSLEDTKTKIEEEYKSKNINFIKVEYDPKKVGYFFARKAIMDKADKEGNYPKRVTKLCSWCEYQSYCHSCGKDTSELVQKELKDEGNTAL